MNLLTEKPSVARGTVAAFLASLLLLVAATGAAQEKEKDKDELEEALATSMMEPGQAMAEVRRFCEDRVARMPAATNAAVWNAWVEAKREEILREVVFRGEAARWRGLQTEVEWLGAVDMPAYRIRKLRFEVVPGMWIPGLLYEPKTLRGKVPVVLNINGHDGKGKAADYKQVRCVNQVLRGMLALNLEWIGMGQLKDKGNSHYKLNQLDLCGTSGIAPFYLSMQRGIDVLLQHEHADPERVAVTGLSGGGCQTAWIMGLDPRVALANPVAGYSSFLTRARHLKDLGDSEQTPSDAAAVCDYIHLTAMRAPRPTLLTYNEKDNCCFAAPYALPPLWFGARPAYELLGRPDNLRSHVNVDPGTHNYLRDNREAFYTALRDYFDPRIDATEIEVEDQLQTAEALAVPLPEDNLTLNGLARKLAAALPAAKTGTREELKGIVRYDQCETGRVRLERIRPGASAVRFGVAGNSATGTWIVHSNDTSLVVFVSDQGRVREAAAIRDLVAEGHSVLALDALFLGESKLESHDFLFALLMASVGGRPLGIQARQVSDETLVEFLAPSATKPRLVAKGRRSSLFALVAAALEPDRFRSVTLHDGMRSLHEVIDQDLGAKDFPEVFCFGLLERFDIDRLIELAGVPVEID